MPPGATERIVYIDEPILGTWHCTTNALEPGLSHPATRGVVRATFS